MIELDGSALTLDNLLAVACDGEQVQLSDTARQRVRAARTRRRAASLSATLWLSAATATN